MVLPTVMALEKGKTRGKGEICESGSGEFLEKNLKSGPLKVHFQLSEAKIRGFVQNTDITFIR